jgi:hypothetical protein
MKLHLIPPIISSGLLIISFFTVTAQVDYADKVSSLKNEFPKEDVIAYQHKEVVNFLLNKDATQGDAKVKAVVTTEVTLVR